MSLVPGLWWSTPESRAWRGLSDAAAEEAFGEWQEGIPSRLVRLDEQMAADGVELALDTPGLVRLEDWFRATVQATSSIDVLASLSEDVALVLAEAAFREGPRLHWSLSEAGSRSPLFRRCVLRGFPDPQAWLEQDVWRSVGSLAREVHRGSRRPTGDFPKFLFCVRKDLLAD